MTAEASNEVTSSRTNDMRQESASSAPPPWNKNQKEKMGNIYFQRAFSTLLQYRNNFAFIFICLKKEQQA